MRISDWSSDVCSSDLPGAVQANIFAGKVAPSTKDDGAVLLEMANEVIGGSFTARLNMNLREDKHWSYGARSMLADAEGQRPWLAYAPVQIDKTRSEEHTSELQSLMRISYAVFCLKKKKTT